MQSLGYKPGYKPRKRKQRKKTNRRKPAPTAFAHVERTLKEKYGVSIEEATQPDINLIDDEDTGEWDPFR